MSNFKIKSLRYSNPPNTTKIKAAYEIMGKIALRILKRQKEKAG